MPKVPGGTVSLERALSKLGLASRAQAHRLILDGRVSVDGRIVHNPSLRIVPERVAIAIDGGLQATAPRVTILLHKPRGYVTTRSDPEGRPTVYDLLTDLPERVVPVGRLDLATSGLLLLTSDTQFGNWLTDPLSGLPRIYLVTVENRATPEIAAALVQGIVVDGERLRATAATIRKASARESHLVVTLTEGKNREIRKLLSAAGFPVKRLRRVQFGGLELGGLAPGKWRRLSNGELREAFPEYAFDPKAGPRRK
ncbi:MAG TPA: pseudouridine synthase [Vicinamibacterales bacterium]